MIDKKTIEKLAMERIDELDKGLFIVAISVSSNNLIKVELDAEQGYVSINDCISVSRNIEHNLDRDKEDFELQVSSAGLDQPFRTPKQYQKNIGKEVKVLLEEGNRRVEGTLVSADENGIKLRWESKEKVEGKKKKVLVIHEEEWPYNQIKETKIVISFKKGKYGKP